MSIKSIKKDLLDPVVPLEIPVGTEDPTDLNGADVGLYFNSSSGIFRIGIAESDSTIKWGSSGIVWDPITNKQ